MTAAAPNAASRFGPLRAALILFLCAAPLLHAQDASTLKARHAELRASLSENQFQRPLHLESSDRSGELEGDIYALIEQPFGTVGPALAGMDHWCDILILHMNIKSCRVSVAPHRDALFVDIGRKFDQPLADAYAFEFLYSVTAFTVDYLEVALDADEGPLGTSRYRIVLQVVALDDGGSFLHLSYGYAYGIAARIAMQGYLSTIGRNKVGFTITGRTSEGTPVYIRSTLGVIERNTMRYYLAVDAYLGALRVPAHERRKKRLEDWYANVERYPVQLHELERDAYLEMKHSELLRQAAPSTAVRTLVARKPAVPGTPE